MNPAPDRVRQILLVLHFLIKTPARVKWTIRSGVSFRRLLKRGKTKDVRPTNGSALPLGLCFERSSAITPTSLVLRRGQRPYWAQLMGNHCLSEMFETCWDWVEVAFQKAGGPWTTRLMSLRPSPPPPPPTVIVLQLFLSSSDKGQCNSPGDSTPPNRVEN